MKILYLAHSGNPHTRKWARHFVQRGDEVHIASLIDTPIEGAAVHPLWRPTKTKLDYFANSWPFRKLVRKLKPDILHAHYATSYGYLGAACSFHPFLITAWGSDILDFPTSALKKKLLRSSLSKADRITAAGKFLAEATENLLGGEQKIVLTPFGVDMETFQPLKKNTGDNLVIGATKSLEPVYGLEFLLRAFAQLGHKNLNILLVGDGSLRQKLKKLASELKIAEKVEFAGNVIHPEIPGYLQKIDILVNPSLRESFGVSVLEAQACEIPVVASNIGGLPEVTEDGITGFLVPPRDINALAEKIGLLVSDEKLRKRMGKAGREFVKKNYDWNENAKIMERLYDSLVKK